MYQTHYATHHKTGRKVGIINQSTSTWKDKKTLVWLDDTVDTNVSWNKYDVGCISVKNYNTLVENKIVPDILVAVSSDDTQWIRNNFRKVKILFVSNTILNELTESFFKENKVNNILSLNEVHLLYSFLGNEWDGTINDACILVSLILRYCETFPLEQPIRNTYSLKVLNELKIPQELWYITQYYSPKETPRRIELMKALSNNVKNRYIDKIVLLNESNVKFEKHSKIEEVIIGKRMFYNDVLEYIYDKVPKDVIVVFANSDIYLDETIRNVWSVNMEDKFFALLRYENDEIYGPRPDSQDSWIISSNSVKSRPRNYKDIEFSFGVMGCDNAIALEMLRQKYVVINPALTIKTHHLHASKVRNYAIDEMVDKNTILYIEATGLHDMEAVKNYKNLLVEKLVFESIDRPILCSNENRSKTFCNMISKKERYNYSLSKNTYNPSTTNIYKIDNVFHTNNGLLYDYDKIYVGNSQTSKEAWAKCQVNTLTPNISSDLLYVSYIPDEYVKDVENYLLYYLSKVLLMKHLVQKDGEFWCVNEPSFINVMRLFKWNQKTMPLLSRNENDLVFAKESYVWVTNDDKEVTKEQIVSLRSFMRQLNSETEQSVVLFIDDTYVTQSFAEEVEKLYTNVNLIYKGTSIERKISYLQNASMVILSSSMSLIQSYGWLWCVKPNTLVYDIQNEMDMNGEVLHIANACELNYHFTTVPRGSLSTTLQNKILEELQSKNIPSNKSSNLPIIVVPKQTEGFFHHKGDSFREIVDIWEEKGYVKKVESNCNNIWMNSVGDILLYDRPNYDWIKNAPAEEQVWKQALFGNPKPLGGKAKSWSFWARRPRLVEAMLEQTFEKTRALVFYGKIENQVQRNNRTKYDWSSCCEKYYMANEDEIPLLSEQKYLDSLSKAKYGLCLAGYGKKCHREVECMALGTVPVCAPEVDMEHYANPPVEGLHFIRVQNPDDAKEKISKISEAHWFMMSEACKKWYRENCSADGMWELTKKLINNK